MGEFLAVIGLAVVFAVVFALVVLRFTSVMQQMNRAYALDRSEIMREIDASHVQAFENAMVALEKVQVRVVQSQVDMFDRTMDMVHGPVSSGDSNGGEKYAVDDPALDMRPMWKPNDDGDDTLLYADQTDDDAFVGLGATGFDDGPRTVSVRPGEGLVPGQ